MSGPKVVRIVTREEIIAACEGHLQRLEQAFARWEAQARRIGELSDGERAATLARHRHLHQLLKEDAFQELQKQVPLEIEFLQRDLAEREERAVDAATRRRQRQRHQRDTARALLAALGDKPDARSADLRERLRAVVAGTESPPVEALLAEGVAHLAQYAAGEAEPLSEAQHRLARALKDPGAPVAEWRADYATEAEREPRLARIDQHLARLQTLHDAASAEPFLRRLAEAEHGDHSVSRHHLLLDSLILDLAEATRALQARRERLARLQALASEVDALLGDTAGELLARIAEADTSADMAQLAELIEQCQAAIAAELKRQAAVARRRAVLQGLANLGYEVREGMETAWADAGRVVLRKSATPGYGVEVGGNADSGRLQVRAVALGDDHAPRRDRDIETIWCGEFQRLRSLLASQGDELEIERALGIGAVPLKQVAWDEGREARETQVRGKDGGRGIEHSGPLNAGVTGKP